MEDWTEVTTAYIEFLQWEKGLAENSVMAYQRDVEKLKDFCVARKISPIHVQREHLQELIHQLYELGIQPRSQARIISGWKQFFNFLVIDDRRTDDPSELVESPRIGRKLPVFLTIEEIDALQSAIDLSKPEGHRNKAILETLYSCGLRVSELITLKFSDLFFDEGFIRVIGKGDKQRLVPVSKTVEKEIGFYLESMRNHQTVQKGNEDIVFLNRRGKGLTRVMIFTIIRQLAEKIGLQKTISPHTFRHSFATHLVEGGANLRAVQEMLGHESITTTEVYTHLDTNFLKEAIISYHPRSV